MFAGTMGEKMNAKIIITSNHVSLVKQAALRHGKELTTAEAQNHAAKIIEWMTGADDEFGQDFWTAAKEYFLN
jgi:hypothetical protein